MNAGDLGADLERLPGVLAATVFSDQGNGPRIYLATGPRADQDALRTAILAVLEDRGITADPARIHVGSPPRPFGGASPLPRVSLDALDVHRSDGRVECQVRLRAETRTPAGRATEPDTASGRARAAARAVLSALETLDPDLRLGLEGVRPLDLFGLEGIVVLVEATVGRSHLHLPGAALVERSIEEAAAIAALTALRSWGA